MQKGFKLIDSYISYSKKITQQDKMMTVSDQKVPQSAYALNSDMYTVPQEEYNIPNILGLSEFSDLEPVAPTSTVLSVPETNNDQLVDESASPKSFLDLDENNFNSLYDENVLNIKAEKDMDHYTYNCSMHNMESSYQIYPQHIKQEEALEDIGLSVIRQLKEEITNTCRILRISPDPIQWSAEDVRKWFVWYSQQYSVPSSIYENFPMNGEQLCHLSDQDFNKRSPEAGFNFYGQLDVWKAACNVNDVECPPSPPQVSCHVQYQQSWYDNVNYIPKSSSPDLSEDSTDSSSSSSNMSYIPQPCHEEYPYSQSPTLRSPVESEHKQTIHLWQFLKDLLMQPNRYNSCIKWIDRQRGIFKIEDSTKVAKLWGLRKNRPAMNYDKLSRSIRQYYKKGIIKKTEHSKRLVYQFCQPYL